MTLRHTTLSYRRVNEAFPKPELDLGALRDTTTNRKRAAEAYEHLHRQGWWPLAPYPGSDNHWRVVCRLCGVEKPMFNSHLRRHRRHTGCLKDDALSAALAHLATHGATPFELDLIDTHRT